MVEKKEVRKRIVEKNKKDCTKQILDHRLQLKRNLELGKNSDSSQVIDYRYRQCEYVYMIISKPNWPDLLDAAGNKLTLPPAWYIGSAMRLIRLLEHDPREKAMTESELKKSAVLRYIKDNNLKPDLNYYFDIYILNFTDFFSNFVRVNHGNGLYKNQLMPYLTALEFYIKYNLYDFFTDGKPPIIRFIEPVNSKLETHYKIQVNGSPIIQRLGDIWNIPKENYMEYNIEKYKPVNDERLFYQHEVMLFFQKLCYSNYKHILDEALTPIKEKQLKEFIDKKAQERRKKNDTIRITSKTLLP